MDETMQQQGEEQATPEEQAQLEQAFDTALDVIHAPGQAGDNIVQMVLDAPQIQKGLGQAVATVLITVEKKMQIPEDMLLALAQEVTAELCELAIEAGALSEDELNEQMLDGIISHATSQYIELKEAMGELDQAKLQSSVQEAQSVMGQQQKPAAPAQSGGLLQRARG